MRDTMSRFFLILELVAALCAAANAAFALRDNSPGIAAVWAFAALAFSLGVLRRAGIICRDHGASPTEARSN